MKAVWVDTNVILRFLTKQPRDLWVRAHRLIQRAEAGEVALRVSPGVTTEVVWLLEHEYGFSRQAIADVMEGLIAAEGVRFEQDELLLRALRLYVEKNVDFVDAYLAVTASEHGEPVASFDRDFKRLGVDLLPV